MTDLRLRTCLEDAVCDAIQCEPLRLAQQIAVEPGQWWERTYTNDQVALQVFALREREYSGRGSLCGWLFCIDLPDGRRECERQDRDGHIISRIVAQRRIVIPVAVPELVL